MNTTPLPEARLHEAPPSALPRQRRLPMALLVATLLTTDCTHPPENPEGPQRYVTEQDASMPDLSEKMTAIKHLVEEKLDNDPAFRSLKTIESFIRTTLGYQWESPRTIDVHIMPFVPKDDTHEYLSVSVNMTSFTLTAQEQQAAEILSDIISDFEKTLHEETLRAFTKWLQECNGEIEVTTLEQKIHTELEKLNHVFIQHGFKYRWVQIGKNKKGEIEIHLLFDSEEGEHFSMPVPTGIMDRAAPVQKERDSDTTEPIIT